MDSWASCRRSNSFRSLNCLASIRLLRNGRLLSPMSLYPDPFDRLRSLTSRILLRVVALLLNF